MLFRLDFSCVGDGLTRLHGLEEADSVEGAAEKLGLSFRSGERSCAIQRNPRCDTSDSIRVSFTLVELLQSHEDLKKLLGIR